MSKRITGQTVLYCVCTGWCGQLFFFLVNIPRPQLVHGRHYCYRWLFHHGTFSFLKQSERALSRNLASLFSSLVMRLELSLTRHEYEYQKSPCRGSVFPHLMLFFPPILAGSKSHLDQFHRPSTWGFLIFILVLLRIYRAHSHPFPIFEVHLAKEARSNKEKGVGT